MALIEFSRTDTSAVGKLWWSVDRWLLSAFILLIIVGVIMTMAATPMAAARIGVTDKFFFVKRHFVYLIPSLFTIFFVASMSTKMARRFCFFIFVASVILIIFALFFGTQVKGARRWITILGVSIQPSEFVKPTFAVVAAWFFYAQYSKENVPGNLISICLFAFLVTLLVLQPDIGMSVVITAAWCGQFFLNGLPIILVIIGCICAIICFTLAYLFLPHVTVRVDKFLDSSGGDNYQIMKSLESFANGGWFGVGPGEGVIKKQLPDAHTDFVFSVMGEEFGVLIACLVVLLFLFIVVRCLHRAFKESNFFSFLALNGLLMQFGMQALINMASALHLIPTKGMTLPFISYGGSSMLAESLVAGLMLCFSRERACEENVRYFR